jgi:hypothetical protein
MTTTKVYKTMIGARMAIMVGKIKSFFKGSHYVAETYTLKFDKAEKLYHVEHYTMTHYEEKEFYEAVAIKQQEIAKVAQKMLKNKPANNTTKVEAPKMNAKSKQTAKPKTQKPNTTNVTQKTASDKPKKKYYYNSNSNKKKSNTKNNGAQQ